MVNNRFDSVPFHSSHCAVVLSNYPSHPGVSSIAPETVTLQINLMLLSLLKFGLIPLYSLYVIHHSPHHVDSVGLTAACAIQCM